MRALICIAALLLATSCNNGQAHGRACARIAPTEKGWWYLPASEGHSVVGAQHALHGASDVTLWDEPFKNVTLEWTRKSRLRRLNWRFKISGDQYRTMRLQFRRPLGGLQVDATAVAETGAMLHLLDRKRIHGQTLDVSWPNVKVRALLIRVHLHLHEAPASEEFRLGYQGPLWSIPGLDPSFSNRNAAYFYDDGLGQQELCRQRIPAVQMPAKSIFGHKARQAKVADAGSKK